jgi:hypothetical protein
VAGTGGATNGTGVFGVGVGSGSGVRGIGGPSGAGVLADSGSGGLALFVNGRADFSQAGVVTIAAGQNMATVTPPGGLTAQSVVLALMQNVAGAVQVRAAVPNVGSGTFVIRLNQAVGTGQSAVVGWFVLNFIT